MNRRLQLLLVGGLCFVLGAVADRERIAFGVSLRPAMQAVGAPVSFPTPITDHDNLSAIFRLSNVKAASIVMLGDSMTALVAWNEITGCPSVVNRAIGSEKTADILDRIDDVTALAPRAVFLMIGVNDAGMDVPTADSMRNLRAILARLTAAGAHVFFLYPLPVGVMPTYPGLNARIDAFNAAAATVVSSTAGVTAIDMRPAFRGADGLIDPTLTKDQVHPSAAGYRVWRDAITPHVAEFCER